MYIINIHVYTQPLYMIAIVIRYKNIKKHKTFSKSFAVLRITETTLTENHYKGSIINSPIPPLPPPFPRPPPLPRTMLLGGSIYLEGGHW